MNGMVKPQDKVDFVDEIGKKYTGFVQKVHNKDTVDIQVSRKMGSTQMYLRVPTPNVKKTNKPYYTELSTKKETPKIKE